MSGMLGSNGYVLVVSTRSRLTSNLAKSRLTSNLAKSRLTSNLAKSRLARRDENLKIFMMRDEMR
jgi:hypothetical protein